MTGRKNAKQRILESFELNDAERYAILGGNAARFFPRLHSVVRERRFVNGSFAAGAAKRKEHGKRVLRVAQRGNGGD